MRHLRDLQQITPHIWLAQGPASNWVILHTSRGVALIDAGYPADEALVLESIRATGAQPQQLTVILLTHAHSDHLGSIPGLLQRFPKVQVYVAAADLYAARGPQREQITAAAAGLRNLTRPRFLLWAISAIRAGGLRTIEIPSAQALTDAVLTEIGIVAHPAPGHTPGSTVYQLSADVYATGDAFITDHPSYTHALPGAIAPHFSADDAAARAAARDIPQPATILPGHGPAMTR